MLNSLGPKDTKGLERRSFVLPVESRHVVIAVNPKAGVVGANDRVSHLVELLTAQALEVAVLSDLDEVTQQCNELHQSGRLRTLIGVGGDGTAAELVNRTPPGIPFTILPSGNENLLARHFRLGSRPKSARRPWSDGACLRCDAGSANDRIFLVMCSCGFDASVVQTVHQHRTGHVSSASYFSPIVDAIRRYDFPELRIDWKDEIANVAQAAASPDNEPRTLPTGCEGVRWLFAFNVPCYGGGLQIAPSGNASDGLLDVCTFRHGGLWHGLYYTAAVLTGTHQWLPDFSVRQSAGFRVTSDGEAPYQLDGDPGGFLAPGNSRFAAAADTGGST